jgi:PTS system nitrogen regulatory IIA component
MDLDVHEVAKLLGVSESQVYRQARDGSLPGYRVHDDYLFNRVEILEWLETHHHQAAPDLYRASGDEAGLSSALARGGVHHAVPGATRDEVLEAVTLLPGVPESVDRELLLQLMLSREALASTGIGDGIALPHPRDPLVFPADGPVVMLCFLAQPVDFGAIDGREVRTLFTLLSPSIRLHLATLARLSYCVHDEAFRQLVSAQAPAAEILAKARALDERVAARPAKTP